MPRRMRRTQHFPNPQIPHLFRKLAAEDLVPIAQQIWRTQLSDRNASRSCCAVHSALGCAVTSTCSIRRRSRANTRNTCSNWNRLVGTMKKSTDTNVVRRLFTKVFQLCEGGFRFRTIYLLPLVSPMSMPSVRSSPCMRGAPQSGLFLLIMRISCRVSGRNGGATAELPRDFQVQNKRYLLRCHAITVAGRTITSADRQSRQTAESAAYYNRSDAVSLGA